MHCNGKCQMMKKLAQEEEKDRNHPQRENDIKFEYLSLPEQPLIISTFNPNASLTKFIKDYCIPISRDPHSIFHPPAA